MSPWVLGLLLLCSVSGHLDEEESKDIECITYNTALYSDVNKGVNFRADLQAEALKKYLDHSAVVCLQGIMYRSNLRQFVEALSGVVPSSVSFMHMKNGTVDTFDDSSDYVAPCNAADSVLLKNIDVCYNGDCSMGTMDPKSIFKCAKRRTECKTLLDKLSQDCVSCLILGDDFNAADKTCQLGFRALNPTGLLLLSDLKISNVERAYLYDRSETKLQQTGYIKADVDGIGEFMCVQMTSKLTNMEIDVNGRSFSEQNKAEAAQIIKAATSNPDIIIAGNLGYSRKSTTSYYTQDKKVLELFPETFKLLKAANLEIQYSSYESGCTFCFANPLVPPELITPGGLGYAPDRILIRRTDEALESQDESHNHEPVVSRLQIESEHSAKPMSNSYGMRVEIPNPKWNHLHTESDSSDDDDNHYPANGIRRKRSTENYNKTSDERSSDKNSSGDDSSHNDNKESSESTEDEHSSGNDERRKKRSLEINSENDNNSANQSSSDEDSSHSDDSSENDDTDSSDEDASHSDDSSESDDTDSSDEDSSYNDEHDSSESSSKGESSDEDSSHNDDSSGSSSGGESSDEDSFHNNDNSESSEDEHSSDTDKRRKKRSLELNGGIDNNSAKQSDSSEEDDGSNSSENENSDNTGSSGSHREDRGLFF